MQQGGIDMKKVTSLLIVLVMVCLTATVVSGAGNKPVKLTLESAVESAVKNDQSLKLLDEKIKLAERRYNMAVAVAKAAPEKYWATEAQHISNKNEELLYPIQREAELNDLKWQRSNLEKKLKTDVTVLYYQILQSQRYIENQNSIIAKSKEEYKAIQKKVQSGMLSESMLMSYEIAVKNSEITLKGYERDISNQKFSFNQKLGNALETEISLAETRLPLETVDIDSIENLVAAVIKESHDVKKLESNKLINKTKYDILVQYSYYRPDECETLEDSLLNIDYDIRDKKAAVELKVRQDYNSILNLKDDISIKQMDYDQKVKLLEISKKKYELGMTTYLDYLDAQSAVDTARVELNNIQLDLYKAVQSFKMYIDPVGL